jgi:hypothetical protein
LARYYFDDHRWQSESLAELAEHLGVRDRIEQEAVQGKSSQRAAIGDAWTPPSPVQKRRMVIVLGCAPVLLLRTAG